MSETRAILEAELQAEPQTDRPDTSHIINKDQEEQIQTSANPEADIYLEAPKSFKKEYAETFKTLPPEMRKYLHERESENTKGFSRLNNELQSRKWIDDFYTSRQDRLQQIGINSAKDWIDYLAKMDDAFAYDPASALQALAQSFNLQNNLSADSSQSSEYQRINQRLASLEQSFNNKRMEEARNIISSFVSAVDDAGALKHPHYEAVKGVIGNLLRSGMASDLESAYEQAVWMNKDIRGELMKAQTESELKTKADEAQKARQAGFNPKGKPGNPPEPELTTRQLLAKKLGISDKI